MSNPEGRPDQSRSESEAGRRETKFRSTPLRGGELILLSKPENLFGGVDEEKITVAEVMFVRPKNVPAKIDFMVAGRNFETEDGRTASQFTIRLDPSEFGSQGIDLEAVAQRITKEAEVKL